jgi:hypothetical protein
MRNEVMSKRNSKERIQQVAKRRSLIEALIALAAFCGLSALSRLFPLVWALVPVSGIAFPLLWAWRTREWARMGFTRRNLVHLGGNPSVVARQAPVE